MHSSYSSAVSALSAIPRLTTCYQQECRVCYLGCFLPTHECAAAAAAAAVYAASFDVSFEVLLTAPSQEDIDAASSVAISMSFPVAPWRRALDAQYDSIIPFADQAVDSSPEASFSLQACRLKASPPALSIPQLTSG